MKQRFRSLLSIVMVVSMVLTNVAFAADTSVPGDKPADTGVAAPVVVEENSVKDPVPPTTESVPPPATEPAPPPATEPAPPPTTDPAPPPTTEPVAPPATEPVAPPAAPVGPMAASTRAPGLSNVVYIDETGYDTLEAAVAKVKDGDTITLAKNCDITSAVIIQYRITLELNGHQLTAKGDYATNTGGPIYIYGGGKELGKSVYGDLTIKDSIGGGKIFSEEGKTSPRCITVVEGGVLTLESGTIEITTDDSFGVVVLGYAADPFTKNPSTVNITGGVLKVTGSNSSAISGNGTGANNTGININGGEVDAGAAPGSLGIYHPQAGVLNINGGIIKGYDGVQMKSGTVNMTGGEIIASGVLSPTDVETAYDSSNGSVKTGCALSLLSNEKYAGEIKANISGGTLTAQTYALYENTTKGDATQVISVGISNGTFTGGHSSVKFNNADKITVNITGGSYNDKIFVKRDGKLVGFYNDLAEAVAGAKAGDTIELAAGTYTLAKGLTIDKDITVQGIIGTILAIGDANTIQVKSRLTLKNLTINANNTTGYGAITITDNDAALTLDTVVLNQTGSGTKDSLKQAIQIATIPGSVTSSPHNITILLKGSEVNMDTSGKGAYVRGICFAEASEGSSVSLDNSKMRCGQYATANGTYSRGIAVLQTTGAMQITLKDSEIQGFYYPINTGDVPGPVTIDINHSTLAGYGALNLWGANAVVNVTNGSLLHGRNYYSGPSDNFAPIVLNRTATDCAVTVADSTIKSSMSGTAYEYALSNRALRNKITLSGTTTIETTATLATKNYFLMGVKASDITVANTVVFPEGITKFASCFLVEDDLTLSYSNLKLAVADVWPKSNDVIELAAGIHTLDSNIPIDGDVIIRGEPGSKLVLSTPLGDGIPLFTVKRGLDDVTLENLTIETSVPLYNVVDAGQSNIKIKNNIITATKNGRIRVAFNSIGAGSEVSGNTVDARQKGYASATDKNSVLSIMDGTDTGTATITGNTFKHFVRGVGIENMTTDTIKPVVSKNKFIDVTYALEIKEAPTTTYMIAYNYHDGVVGKVAAEKNSTLQEYTGDAVTLYPYYSDAAMTTLVYKTDPMAPIVKAAIEAARKALSDAGITTALESITGGETIDSAKKGALQAEMTRITKALSGQNPDAMNAYLAKNPTEKALLNQITVLFNCAYKIVPTPPTAENGVPSTKPAERELAADLANEITQAPPTDDPNAPLGANKPVQGLAQSLILSGNAPEKDAKVFLDVTISDVVLAPANPDVPPVPDAPPVSPIIETLTFTVKPMVQPQGEGASELPPSSISGTAPITFRLPIPRFVTQSHVRIVHEYSSRAGSETMLLPIVSVTDPQDGVIAKYVEVTIYEFSTFTVSFYNPAPPSGDSEESEDDFWMEVAKAIESAKPGETITAKAGAYQKMSDAVMAALRSHPGVSLIITRGKGESDILIPAGKAKKSEPNRVYWPLEELAELYRNATPAAATGPINPVTGGVTIAAPGAIQPAPDAVLAAPAAVLPGVATAAQEPTPVVPRSNSLLLGGIALAMAALIVATGVLLFKKRNI